MKSYDLNEFPALLENNKLTKAEAIQKIAEFIVCNYRVFNLQLYDEDFREEIILIVLEKGITIFDNYKPELGDFFTYLYSYIYNIASTLKKKHAKTKLEENITEIEIIRDYKDSCYQIPEPSYKTLQDNTIPFKSSKKITPQELREGLYFPENSKIEKTILSLAIKSSFYLDDEMVSKICSVIGVDKYHFTRLIEYYKMELVRKIEKRNRLEGYRNKAYYCHKKYEHQIQLINQEMKLDFNTNQKYIYEEKLKKLKHNNEKQIHNWERLNKKFQNGCATVKPSNLSIANLLGICERQVSYYLFCAKNGKTDLSEICKKLEEIDKD